MAMIRPETEMKDSGIEWIGDIPANWGKSKLKYLGVYINGYAFKPSDWSARGRQIIRIQDLTGSNSGEPNYFDGTLDEKYRVVNGDILVSWAATLDAFVWTKEDGWLNQHIFKAVPNEKIVKGYFLWLLKVAMDNMNNDDKHGIVMQHVTIGLFNNYVVPLAPYTEQQAIADYLDETCSKIDEIIAEAKASIAEYKELKQSVIFEAVTKGLDKNVEMKDSGVEWIGEIPVDWNIAKINRVAWTTSGATPLRSKETEYYDNAVIRWVRTLDLNNGHVTDSSEKITETALKNSSCSIMPVKTVCVAMYGGSGTIGKSGILEVECATNQAICSIVSDKKVLNPDYLHYVIMAVRKYWMKYAVGTRKDPNINQQIIAQMRIPIPQLSKQDIIVNHLDKVTDKCDSLIAEKESLINDLEAYKKSLIYEVVTGKRRVV